MRRWLWGFSFILICFLLSGCGQDPGRNFNWREKSDGTVCIDSYIGDEEQVDVPESIGGKAVTEIGSGAFRNKPLRTITIPPTVELIQSYAFFNLEACTEITVGNKMALQTDDIFQQCPGLKRVNTEGDGTIVWFLGNSLIEEGNLNVYFEDICREKGDPVVCYTNTADGYTLEDHLSDFSEKVPETARLTADVLMIQPIDQMDEERVDQLRRLCRDGVKIYLIGTNYSTQEIYQMIQDTWKTPLDGFTWGGEVCDQLISQNKADFYDLYWQDGIHPTFLNGFISGACIYRSLYRKPVSGIDYTKMRYSLESFIPAATAEEKKEKIRQYLEEAENYVASRK